MVKENIIIGTLKLDDLKDVASCHLTNCIINTIDLIGAFEVNANLVVENCIIENLQIHSCWFKNGFVLKNCIVKNYVDYQMGGHNEKPIIFLMNIFLEFVNFFDCQFQNLIELKENYFVKGSNLLGNKGEGFENIFVSGWIEERNIGRIDFDGIGK